MNRNVIQPTQVHKPVRTALLTLLVALFAAGMIACEDETHELSGTPVEDEASAEEHAAALEGQTQLVRNTPSDDTSSTVDHSSSPPVKAPGAGALLADEENTIDVFEAVAPATVFVTQKRNIRRSRWSRGTEVPAGSGTGFIWDRDGHVVTNYHVIDGADALEVTLHNQKSYDASLIGGEPRKDIAVLKIDAPASELTPVELPSKDYRVTVGQKTVAIGNPFGLDHTLTTGIVSALGREIPGYGGVSIRDMIQTDASINPGNSGGPLTNSSGELIGVNTMIFSKSGSSAGIGFAVPVRTVRRIVPQIIETGKAEQVGLGISVLNDATARRAGIKGVVITAVLSCREGRTAAAHARSDRCRARRRHRRARWRGDRRLRRSLQRARWPKRWRAGDRPHRARGGGDGRRCRPLRAPLERRDGR